MRLCVGVIGAGSVGSLVAEGLARTGIGRILLIDFDFVEEVNLDRLLHAAPQDVSLKELKVEVLARALRSGSATAEKFSAEPIEWGVTEPVGFRAALDCDVLFSCVDRPWPRSVLNFIAYAHLIPVIDGGIYAERGKHGGVLHADWRTSVIGPERSCLECLGQYSSENVSAEREGFWDDPEYIRGLPRKHMPPCTTRMCLDSASVWHRLNSWYLRLVVPVNGMPGPMAPTTYHFKNAALRGDCYPMSFKLPLPRTHCHGRPCWHCGHGNASGCRAVASNSTALPSLSNEPVSAMALAHISILIRPGVFDQFRDMQPA